MSEEKTFVKPRIGGKEYFAIFVLLFVFGSIVMFDLIVSTFQGLSTDVDESRKTTQEISNLIISLDQLTFDTSILNNQYFDNLKNIPAFPVLSSDESFGKRNPFVGGVSITPTKVASTTVGGLIYSNQREDGAAPIRGVQLDTRRR